MSNAEEATVNPDGSTTFETPPAEDSHTYTGDDGGGAGPEGFEQLPLEEVLVKGIDPAFYLLALVALLGVLYYVFVYRRKLADDEDEFFANLDGVKVRLLLLETVWNECSIIVCVAVMISENDVFLITVSPFFVVAILKWMDSSTSSFPQK
jgi:hypothetical protein